MVGNTRGRAITAAEQNGKMNMARLITLVFLALLAAPSWAQQNLFAPVARVNDRIITGYELNQRFALYGLLRAPGNSEEFAMDNLINERLQLEAAAAAGITVSEDEVAAGMEEFAGRANLTAENFVKALNANGVSEETFQDFVRAGLAWRGVVRQQFGPRAQVSEAEVDRAVALASNGASASSVRVLISEIFLPADTPSRKAAAERRAEQLSKITTLPAFSAAARKYSAAPSRGRGGRQDWIPIGNLPPAIRTQVLTLSPGQVTDPIPTQNAIALFQLRDIEEIEGGGAEALSVEFARFFIPGGRTESTLAQAERIKAEIDTCDDLYGVLGDVSEDRLLRDVLPISDIAGDIVVELAKLDDNEVSTNLTTGDGQALVFLMLCGRTYALAEDTDRDAIRQNLVNQRLGSYASGFLSELRADAVIQRQ